MFPPCLSSPPVFTLQPARAQQICQGIAGVVAGEFELTLTEVEAATRGAPRAAYARQVAMYLAHVSFALSF